MAFPLVTFYIINRTSETAELEDPGLFSFIFLLSQFWICNSCPLQLVPLDFCGHFLVAECSWWVKSWSTSLLKFVDESFVIFYVEYFPLYACFDEFLFWHDTSSWNTSSVAKRIWLLQWMFCDKQLSSNYFEKWLWASQYPFWEM